MPDYRLYARTLAEQFVLLLPLVPAVRRFRGVGDQYPRLTRLLLPAAAPVAGEFLQPEAREAFALFQRLVDGVAVVLVPERTRADDDAVPCPDDGGLVAELVPLVLLAIADAADFRLVERVDLVLVVALLRQHLFVQCDLLRMTRQEIRAEPLQVPLQLPDQTARYGVHFPVRPKRLLPVLGMAAETLVPVEGFQRPLVALAHRKTESYGQGDAPLDDLFRELGVCRIGDVLLLDGRIDECGPATVFPVPEILAHGDAPLQDQLHPLLADALAEVRKLRRRARLSDTEILAAAEILEINVLLPPGDNALVGQVAQVLQYQQARHQADRLARTAVVIAVQFPERFLEHLPMCPVGKLVQGGPGIELVGEVEEHGALVGDNGFSIHFLQGFRLQIYAFLQNQTSFFNIILL